MKKLTLILIVLTFVFAVSAQDANVIFNRGLQNLNAKNYDAAIADFSEAIRLNPTLEAYHNRGQAYLGKRKLEKNPSRVKNADGTETTNGVPNKTLNGAKAIADFTKTIELSPAINANSPRAVVSGYINRSQAFLIDGDYEAAIADFRKVLAVKPELGTANNNSALAQMQNEAADYFMKAAENLSLSINLSENSVKVGKNIGEDVSAAERKLESDKQLKINFYQKAAQYYQPNTPELFYKRGNARRYAGNLKGAIADYQESLRQKPNVNLVASALAEAYADDKQYDLAVAEYEKIIANSQGWEAYKDAAQLEIARIRAKTGKLDEALQFYNQHIAKKPNVEYLYLERGRIHLQKGDKNLARADFNKAIQTANGVYAHLTVEAAQKELDILDGKNKTEPVKKPVAQIKTNPPPIKPAPTPPIVKPTSTPVATQSKNAPQPVSQPALAAAKDYFYRGKEYYYAGKADEAIADFTEAIRLDKNHADAYFFRADALRKWKSDYEKAIADYSEVIKIIPAYVNAYYWRGTVYETLGEFDLAKADYQITLKKAPNHNLAKERLAKLAKQK